MYKLTVIAGPARGAMFAVSIGESSIGRQAGNTIVLSSSKISKRHCVIYTSEQGVVVKDAGSSNGTFVNGTLIKERALKVGDRLSVGEYVLELSQPVVRPVRAAPSVASIVPAVVFNGAAGASPSDVNAIIATQIPTDLKGKAKYYFEKFVMPVFYSMNQKNEWHMIGMVMLAAFVLANLIVSVYPLMERNRQSIIDESRRRAQFMAREIIERNSAAIAQGAETKTDIGIIEKEEGVRLAVLSDLDGRIIAPATKLNSYITVGDEASVAMRVRDAFRRGRETGAWDEVGSSLVVAVEPLKVLDSRQGKNVVVGMAIVSIDASLAIPSFGEMGVAYSETLIITAILGALIMFILYRLTLRPYEILNDDIDKVLKGEMSQVTQEFKLVEMKPLWDIVDSVLQRLPKGGAPGEIASSSDGVSTDDAVNALKIFGEASKMGMLICDGDRKVTHMNPMFEEISGIRLDSSLGQELNSVVRDQSFGAFSADVFDRAIPGGAALVEDYDFSGITYKVYVTSLGSSGAVRCYVMAAAKMEG